MADKTIQLKNGADNAFPSGAPWAFLANASGGTHISLPSGWHEIYVRNEDAEFGVCYCNTFYADKLPQSNSHQSMLGGGYGANNAYGLGVCVLTATEFYLKMARWNDTDRMSNFITTIWYR